MAQFNHLTITPIDGSDAVTLNHIGEITGPINKVAVFSFDEHIGDYGSSLATAGVLKRDGNNVEHERNRTGYALATTDPGFKLVTVTWKEYHINDAGGFTATDMSEVGVMAITGASTGQRNALRLTLYIANARYERITNLVEEAA